MTITLTPEIERALTARAAQQGTTPELLALHDLHELYAEAAPPDPFEGKTLADVLAGRIGRIDSRENKRSIMEMEGLGAEQWKDESGTLLDAQEYVDELRRE